MHACWRRPGYFPQSGGSWYLQVVSLQLMMDICPLHLHFSIIVSLVGKHRGRKPPAGRSALFTCTYRTICTYTVHLSTGSCFWIPPATYGTPGTWCYAICWCWQALVYSRCFRKSSESVQPKTAILVNERSTRCSKTASFWRSSHKLSWILCFIFDK